jgi:signal transduction histidine kinase
MVKRPRSFRHLLLLRILLISIPILLIGQAMTLRKARSSLLETARQNLTSSAIQKADELEHEVATVQGDLSLLSRSSDLRSGTLPDIRSTFEQFMATVPYQVDCMEVWDGDKIALTTCSDSLLSPTQALPWTQQAVAPSPANAPTNFAMVSLNAFVPPVSLSSDPQDRTLISLVMAAPVYNAAGNLRYTLAMKAGLSQLEDTNPRSLVGNTVIIDAKGKIVVHPDPQQVGQPITTVAAAERLESIVGSVRAGNAATIHLFNFAQSGDEWLAGYSGARITVAPGQVTTWTVLAATPLKQALHALKDIRQILILLTLGLLGANALLALYIAFDLSLPVERLIRYAQQVQDLSHLKPAPRHRSIWELDYLGQVLESMLHRLEAGATELRQAWKDAQLANQLKNEFLANTSHELRTPLNAIIGCIRLVRDGCCDDRVEEMEFLERADNAAIHLLKIINDILDIAKIEAGTVAMAMEPTELKPILQEVLDMQCLQIQQKGLMLNRPAIPDGLKVKVDVGKFKQVLLNIIYNAVKFTHQGGITVEVAEAYAPAVDEVPAAAVDRASACVKITIRDTGIGIDPKEQHKLFRPFVMVDGSHTRRYEGTGLGLAISKNLMQLMEGDITLYSAGRDQGTAVTVTLPLLAVTAEASSLIESARAKRTPEPANASVAAPAAVSAADAYRPNRR